MRLNAANTYYVVVDGYFGDCGSYNISTSFTAGCPPVCDPEDCRPWAVDENEPVCGPNYVDAFNGGCNSVPNVFSEVDCFTTICGTGGTYSFNGLNYRDTDWYSFDSFGYVTVTLCASFDAQLAVIDGNGGCDLQTIVCGPVFGPAGTILTCNYWPFSGPNWVFVAPSSFAGVPCGSPYTLSICCVSKCVNATESKTWGGIKALYR